MPPEPVALATIATLILVKEAGLPVPVPGDLIVLGAGAAAGHGELDPATALAALIVASVVGGAIQFALLTTAARGLLLRTLARVGIPIARLDAQAERLRAAGARGVAIARMTPGVRVVAIPAAAIAGVGGRSFLGGLAAGNAVFIALHFGLGLVLGEPIVAAAGSLLGPLAAAGIVLAAIGAAGWLVVARRRRGPVTTLGLPVAAWADATCPACLAVAVAEASRA